MKRYGLLIASLTALMLGLFVVVEALEVPILSAPQPWLSEAGPAAAATGVALLIGDVVLPVPSSLVMIAHGALFGTLRGAALSVAGALGAAMLGFFLGRRGAPIVARLVPADERRRADVLLARWGYLFILVTRPIPVVAEVAAMVAGASAMTWSRLILASLVGSLPAALLYSLVGATAATFDAGLVAFALVLAVSGLAWWWLRGSPPSRHGSGA